MDREWWEGGLASWNKQDAAGDQREDEGQSLKETYRIRYDAGSGGVLISTSQGRIPTDISIDLKKRLVVKKKQKKKWSFPLREGA